MLQGRYWMLLFCLGLAVSGSAQTDPAHTPFGRYYFEGEEVVFEFDRKAYLAALQSKDSLSADFFDLSAIEVVLMRKGQKKTREGWVMQRIDGDIYQLRKPLAAFKDAPNWQFKFLINGKYWADPAATLKKQGALGWLDLNNSDLPGPPAGDTGNVVFKLYGFVDAKEVILTGTFNNWDEHKLKMQKVSYGWELHLSLKPGEYEYKFIADGKWLDDPANPKRRENQYDTYNSIVQVNKPVRFELKGFQKAKAVWLAGDFTNWEQGALKMNPGPAGWELKVPLVGGKHLYKYIVDGNWMVDPDNPRREDDGKGNVNSVLFVR